MTTRAMPFSYAVSEFTTMPWTFEDDVARYAALGVEAIGTIGVTARPSSR